MNTEIVYEYWDAELKDQFKRRLATVSDVAAGDRANYADRTTSCYHSVSDESGQYRHWVKTS